MTKFQHFTLICHNQFDEEELDREWVTLIQEALIMGITPEEIKVFLHSYSVSNHKKPLNL